MLKKTIKIPLNINVNFDNPKIIYFININTNKKMEYNISQENSLSFEIINKNLIISNINLTKTIFFENLIILKKIIKETQKKFKIRLYLKGLGFKANFNSSNTLILKLGYSHTINIKTNIKVNIINSTVLICYSNNLNELTQFASLLKSYKIPEPYKGKGIFYENEIILKKHGKREKK